MLSTWKPLFLLYRGTQSILSPVWWWQLWLARVFRWVQGWLEGRGEEQDRGPLRGTYAWPALFSGWSVAQRQKSLRPVDTKQSVVIPWAVGSVEACPVPVHWVGTGRVCDVLF